MSNILQELRCVFRNEDPIDVGFSLQFLSKFSLMAHASWIQTIKNDTEIQNTSRLDFGMDDVHNLSHSLPVQINRGHQFLQGFYPSTIKDSTSINEAIIEKSREIQYIAEHGLKNGNLNNALSKWFLYPNQKNKHILGSLNPSQKTQLLSQLEKDLAHEQLSIEESKYLSQEDKDEIIANLKENYLKKKTFLHTLKPKIKETPQDLSPEDILVLFNHTYQRCEVINFLTFIQDHIQVITEKTESILGLMCYALEKTSSEKHETYVDTSRLESVFTWCIDCKTANTIEGKVAESCWKGSEERASLLGYAIAMSQKEQTTPSQHLKNLFSSLSEAYVGNKISTYRQLPEAHLVNLVTLIVMKLGNPKHVTHPLKWHTDEKGKLSDKDCHLIPEKYHEALFDMIEIYVTTGKSEQLISFIDNKLVPELQKILEHLGFNCQHAGYLAYATTLESCANTNDMHNKSLQHWAYMLSRALDYLSHDNKNRAEDFPKSLETIKDQVHKSWLNPIYDAYDKILNESPEALANYLTQNNMLMQIPPLRDEQQTQACIKLLSHPSMVTLHQSFDLNYLTGNEDQITHAMIECSSKNFPDFINRITSNGKTMAHYIMYFPLQTFSCLLEHIDPKLLSHRDENGDTPLLSALKYDYYEYDDNILYHNLSILCSKMQSEDFLVPDSYKKNCLDYLLDWLEQQEKDSFPYKRSKIALEKIAKHIPQKLFFIHGESEITPINRILKLRDITLLDSLLKNYRPEVTSTSEIEHLRENLMDCINEKMIEEAKLFINLLPYDKLLYSPHHATPIHQAIDHKQEEIAIHIIRTCPPIADQAKSLWSVYDKDGNSFLHLAIEKHLVDLSLELTHTLPAEILQRVNHNKKTPLDLAYDKKLPQIAQKIIEKTQVLTCNDLNKSQEKSKKLSPLNFFTRLFSGKRTIDDDKHSDREGIEDSDGDDDSDGQSINPLHSKKSSK